MPVDEPLLTSEAANMSATTVDNPIATAVSRQVLQDYDIHLTGDETVAPPNSDSRRPQTAPTAANPPGWGTEHRGVPPYRPINRELDLTQRPLGGNPVGDVFVATMFTGVFFNANVRWLWTKTGGRINDKIFHYEVGGEI